MTKRKIEYWVIPPDADGEFVASMKDRRIGEIETLQTEIAALSNHVNQKQRAVDWQFTIDKARVKLNRLYPKI